MLGSCSYELDYESRDRPELATDREIQLRWVELSFKSHVSNDSTQLDSSVELYVVGRPA